MTVQQLRAYDGLDGKNDGRILMACDGKIFDVTRGKRNYGPGTVFHVFDDIHVHECRLIDQNILFNTLVLWRK